MRNRILFTVLTMLLLSSCGMRHRFMKYEVVFSAPLGTEPGQIGSNMALMEAAFPNKDNFLVEDYLDVPNSIQIYRNKIYIADTYNNRVSIFKLQGAMGTNVVIPGIGADYAFRTPYQVVLNKYGEIFVLAAQTNSVTTNSPNSVYYIYKFGVDGDFIYRLGLNGVNSGPMTYPDRIDVDLFDNLYVYFKDYNDNAEYWIIKRFSPSGELGFEFNTRYVILTNVVENETYYGQIGDIYNLKNDERLLIYSSYRIIKRNNQELVTPDKFFNSVDVYSVLKNRITDNLMRSQYELDGIMGITTEDEVVFYGYDQETGGVHFRFKNLFADQDKESVYYAPDMSSYYGFFLYYMDSKGELYSIIVKDNGYYVVLHWLKKRKISI